MEAATYQPFDDEEFEELARPHPGHWRADLKWVFGIMTSVLLFITLAVAGAYRVTGPGAARQVLTPLIDGATEVKEAVKDNYQDLRSKARRMRSGSITIPDVGMSVSIEASAINDVSSQELADQVVVEIERQIYSNGYTDDLPMKEARGAGEERARAVAVTLLSEINRQNHQALLWVLLILAVLTLAFAVPFLVLCVGWGKVIGPAVAIILAAAPASLAIRICSEFLWRPGVSGAFRPAAWQALRSASSTMVVFFDVAMGAGALLLMVGVIGSILSKRSRDRVPPFIGLKRPEEAVAGGSPLEPGLKAPEMEQEAGEPPLDAFKDLEPPHGEQ